MLVALELWGVPPARPHPSEAMLRSFVKFLQHLVGVTILEDIFEKLYGPPLPSPLKRQKQHFRKIHWEKKKKNKSMPERLLSFFGDIWTHFVDPSAVAGPEDVSLQYMQRH